MSIQTVDLINMLTTSCPRVCTSTLFMLWDGKEIKKPIH